MGAILLIIGFSITTVVCFLNICLLWDHTGTGLLLSEILSALTAFLILAYTLIPSGIKWILVSKLTALIVMVAPLFLDEYRRYIPIDLPRWYLAMNVMLIPICVISTRAIYSNQK